MVKIRHEHACDIPAREALLDRAFGEARFRKTAERLRETRLPAEGLSFVADANGAVVGTIRLWPITTESGQPALLLGPLAVDGALRDRGIGAGLMRHATEAARDFGHAAVLLVGDAPYYGRFGFSAEKTGALYLPGPFERHRLLGRELVPGALDNAHGLIIAAGLPAQATGLPIRIPERFRLSARSRRAA